MRDSSYLGQVRRAISFELELQATLIYVFRKHKKLYFRFHHDLSGDTWDTTLSKLENYKHNKFRKYKMGTLLTRQEAIVGFINIHGDTYDYSNMEYINGNTKIEIICDIHGSFLQKPRMHKTGQGCPQCAKALDGWSYTAWEEKGKISKHFDSFKVYIIKVYSKDEEFIKIGKTFNTLHKRFIEKNRIPYSFEILKVFEGDARDMSELEVRLQNMNSMYKHIPKIKFDGSNECFSHLKKETYDN